MLYVGRTHTAHKATVRVRVDVRRRVGVRVRVEVRRRVGVRVRVLCLRLGELTLALALALALVLAPDLVVDLPISPLYLLVSPLTSL